MGSNQDEHDPVPGGGGGGTLKRQGREIDRREMMKRVAGMGLQTMAVAAVVGGAARLGRADPPDCGSFNPETGGVWPDATCATYGDPPIADYDCARPRDASGNYWEDNRCTLFPMLGGDADCGSQTGFAPGGGGPVYQSDSSCGVQGERDDDCGLPAPPDGSTTHSDSDGQ